MAVGFCARPYSDTSAPAVTGSIHIRIFILFLGRCIRTRKIVSQVPENVLRLKYTRFSKIVLKWLHKTTKTSGLR